MTGVWDTPCVGSNPRNATDRVGLGDERAGQPQPEMWGDEKHGNAMTTRADAVSLGVVGEG